MNLYCFNRYILSFFIDHLLGVQVTVFSTYTHTHTIPNSEVVLVVCCFFSSSWLFFFLFFFALQCSPSDERRLSNQRWAEKLDDCFDIIFFCLPIFSSPLVRFSSICDLFAPMNLRPSIKKKHHHHWSSFPWIWIEFRSKLIKFRSFSCYHHISLANFIHAIFSHYWMRWSGNQVSWKVNKMQWEKNISVMKMWEWGKENVYQVDLLVYSNDLWLHRISHTVCIRTEQMTSCENIAAVNVLREREMYNHNL